MGAVVEMLSLARYSPIHSSEVGVGYPAYVMLTNCPEDLPMMSPRGHPMRHNAQQGGAGQAQRDVGRDTIVETAADAVHGDLGEVAWWA